MAINSLWLKGLIASKNWRRYLCYHYRLLHLSDTGKKLGAAKHCKNLLREPSDEAALFTSHVTETIGRPLSDPAEDSRLVTIVPTDQSRVAKRSSFPVYKRREWRRRMGSGGIVRDLPWIEALGANLWPFPSVIQCGGFLSVPSLGKQLLEGKGEELPAA